MANYAGPERRAHFSMRELIENTPAGKRDIMIWRARELAPDRLRRIDAKLGGMRRVHDYPRVLEEAADEARGICLDASGIARQPAGSRPTEGPLVTAEGIPADLGHLVAGIGRASEGTGYWDAYREIARMVFDAAPAVRLAGRLLLAEFAYGRRHQEHCNNDDLWTFRWTPGGVDLHLANDPILRSFEKSGGWEALSRHSADLDYSQGAPLFQLLDHFLANGLEYAALGLVHYLAHLTWPKPAELAPETNEEAARQFESALRAGLGKGMPLFWTFAYELTAGEKCMPKNNAFFDATRGVAREALGNMRDELQLAEGVTEWLHDNAACTFVGTNDLASLAIYLYREANAEGDAELAKTALDVLGELANHPLVEGKLKHKQGVPKAELGLL